MHISLRVTDTDTDTDTHAQCLCHGFHIKACKKRVLTPRKETLEILCGYEKDIHFVAVNKHTNSDNELPSLYFNACMHERQKRKTIQCEYMRTELKRRTVRLYRYSRKSE